MLRFDSELIEATYVRRYKRFFADFEDRNGQTLTAHCANTGRMTGLLHPGRTGWLRAQPPGRKLAFAWELMDTPEGLACVNTARANQLLSVSPTESWLPGATWVGREPRVGSHRFDLAFEREGAPVYVEVKSVTLCESGRGAFPDAPSERAQSHVALLASMAAEGVETHLVWVAMHAGIRTVEPARWVDPKFSEACRLAADAGVHFHALSTQINLEGIALGAPLPWHLSD